MGKHSDDRFNKDQNRVHDLQREEDEVAANHARRGEAEYAGKRTNAAGATRDKQQDAIDNRKGRGKKSDAMWDTIVLNQTYWQQEYETFDGYVNALDDYQTQLETRLEAGGTFKKEELPQDVLAAILRYEAENPGAKVDWNDPESIKQVRDWAAGERAEAHQKLEIGEDYIKPTTEKGLQQSWDEAKGKPYAPASESPASEPGGFSFGAVKLENS